MDEGDRFYFTGPLDHRKCEICRQLIYETNPFHTSTRPSMMPVSDPHTPMTLDALMDRIDTLGQHPRADTPHPMCRDTFVRSPFKPND